MVQRWQWIPIELTLEQAKEGERAGTRRQIMCRYLNRAPAAGENMAPEEKFYTDWSSCRAERAGKVYLDPIYWHAYETAERIDNLPDLQNERISIDVKSAPYVPDERPRRLICADKHIHKDWAYMLVLIESRFLHWLVGWERGEVLARAGYLPGARWKGDCRCLEPEELRDVRELLELVHGKVLA